MNHNKSSCGENPRITARLTHKRVPVRLKFIPRCSPGPHICMADSNLILGEPYRPNRVSSGTPGRQSSTSCGRRKAIVKCNFTAALPPNIRVIIRGMLGAAIKSGSQPGNPLTFSVLFASDGANAISRRKVHAPPMFRWDMACLRFTSLHSVCVLLVCLHFCITFLYLRK